MKITQNIQFLLAVLAVALAIRPAAAQSGVILGVLEDTPSDASGEPNTRVVRVIFKKIGNDWQPLPADCGDQECLKRITAGYPREVTWTIAFDGKGLGQITSRTPKQFSMYWRVGQQDIYQQKARSNGRGKVTRVWGLPGCRHLPAFDRRLRPELPRS